MSASPRTRLRRRIAVVLVALFAAVPLAGCDVLDLPLTQPSRIPDPSNVGAPSVPVEPTDDYFTILGPAAREYKVAAPGQIEYCPLDELERAVCAYGELTSSLLEQERREDREDITVDPAGWPEDNEEIAIPALEHIEGSTSYRGWMMNRSHLIADSLGGAASAENLVTGTRTQNVGSHQKQGEYAGGMAHTEVLARDYLSSGVGDTCPLYYAATPQYQANELVPRTVIVDIVSCDRAIDQRVEVANTAAGWEIDYRDGSFAPAT